MNDVEQGGATVFPLLKRKFVPKKGTAVFWYNFLVNGKIDNRTLHASCPVISGSKWSNYINSLCYNYLYCLLQLQPNGYTKK